MADRLFSDYATSGELEALYVNGSNADALGTADTGFQSGAYFGFTFDSTPVGIGFTDQHGIDIVCGATHGQYTYGVGGSDSRSKTTYKCLSTTADWIGMGQRFAYTSRLNAYGMGDFFHQNVDMHYASGPIAGDEGIGWQSVTYLVQQETLTLFSIASKPTQSTMNTTLTATVTGAMAAQTVSVASTTGATVGQWVVVNQVVSDGYHYIEAVQIEAVGSGTITGIFRNNYASGTTITPALVIVANSGSQLGQGRVLVNLSGSTYTTGTVSSTSGGQFNGSGTTWTTSMVGGTATNIGAIALDNDTYTGPPFDSTGANGPLKTWHQIISVPSTTSLGIHSFSCGNNQAYKGRGVGSGGYTIRPAARILRISGTTLICETSAHTWSVGHSIEQIICPYPDVSPLQYVVANYTPNNVSLNSVISIENRGARAFTTGISIHSENMKVGGGADTTGFTTGVYLDIVDYGLTVNRATIAAISLPSTAGGGTDVAGKIKWPGAYICGADLGMEFQMVSSGNGGLLKGISSSTLSESLSKLSWTGSMSWTGYADIAEMTAPAAPASNTARLYADDSGGKTRLMVRFPTGTVQQIAIEP